MDSWELLQFIEDISPKILNFDGIVFLDRENVGELGVRKKIDEYASKIEAQRWINSVPIDNYLEQIIENWNLADPNISRIREVYKRAWLNACIASGVDVSDCSVVLITDDETGDVIIRLTQTAAHPS